MTSEVPIHVLSERSAYGPDSYISPRSVDGWYRGQQRPGSALSIPAIWSCLMAIADGVTSLPLKLYKRTDKGIGEEVPDHPSVRALSEPESQRDGFAFRHSMALALAGWGNAYARIVRAGGEVQDLQFFHPAHVSIEGVGRRIRYHLSDSETTYQEEAINVLHVVGPSVDGLEGLSPLAVHQRLHQGERAMEEFGRKIWENGAVIQGVAETDQNLSEENRKQAQENWRKTNGINGENAGGIGMFTHGLKLKPWNPIPPGQAQYVENQKFSAAKIAMVYGVPLHKLGLLENATLSNVAELDRAFIRDTLAPYRQRIEAALNMKLLRDPRGARMYFQHDVSEALRGSPKEQAEVDRIRIMAGFLKPEEARLRMNLPPDMDGCWRPANVVVVGEEPAEPSDPNQLAPPPGDEVLDADPTDARDLVFNPWSEAWE